MKLSRIRSFGRPGRRMLVASLMLLVAVAIVALPANAGKRTPSTAASISATANTCTFHVTYSWSGVSGATNAYLRVLYQIPGESFARSAAADNVAVSGRSGTASVDLFVSGPGFQNFYGRGSLQNRKDQEITGSQATSQTSVAASC